jgi:hypothetical protein
MSRTPLYYVYELRNDPNEFDGFYLDTKKIQDCPLELSKSPAWRVVEIIKSEEHVLYKLSGRDKQAYRKDICAGFAAYTCELYFYVDGSTSVKNVKESIVD